MKDTTPKAPRERLLALAKEKGLQCADRKFAQLLDKQDELASFKKLFYLPQIDNQDSIYFCGNSLGLQPKSTINYIKLELEEWATKGVEAHFDHEPVDYAKCDGDLEQIADATKDPSIKPWLTTDENIHARVARTLVGAVPIEVAIMNGLSVNLNLMLVPFYRPTKQRHKILIEAHAFPSDRYAVQSHIKFHGLDPETSLIQMEPREGERTLRTEDIETLIAKEGDSIALVMFSGIQYYSGQLFDMKRITAAGHAKGCVVGFDLAHAVGNVIIKLHEWDVDWAVWCHYKYVNSGPGSIAGVFVHERHANAKDLPRFSGWWGNKLSERFDMTLPFNPEPGAFGFRLSNPPVIACATVLASLRIFEAATMPRIRAKAELLTGYLEELLLLEFADEIERITPKDYTQRGSQLSVLYKKADIDEVSTELKKRRVICDLRKPGVMRIAPVPLYNSFDEVWRFVDIMKQILHKDNK